MIGTLFGNYKITHKIGAGGQGRTNEAGDGGGKIRETHQGVIEQKGFLKSFQRRIPFKKTNDHRVCLRGESDLATNCWFNQAVRGRGVPSNRRPGPAEQSVSD